MTMLAKPNSWVAVDDAPTRLTYGPRVNPAPLTTSVKGREPTLGSLVVVITNNTPEALSISAVRLTVVVGEPSADGSPLMSSLVGVKTEVSDPTDWSFSGPPSGFHEGLAEFTLKPLPGSSGLAAGASVMVEIDDFPTVEEPGTSIVAVEEDTGLGRASTSFSISTFPSGFFFDGLVATIVEGSAHVPVAQVARSSQVILIWNTSVISTAAQKVRYSSATGGQQSEPPTAPGQWKSPPLTGDTVFSVSVEATAFDGEPMVATLATSVAVGNPDLVADSVSAQQLTAGGVSAQQLTANAVTAGSATVNGALAAKSAKVDNDLHAESLVVERELEAKRGPISLLGDERIEITLAPENSRRFVAPTDGLVVGIAHPEWVGGSTAWAHGRCGELSVYATGAPTATHAPYPPTNSFVLPVAKGDLFGLEALPNYHAAAFYWVPFGTGNLIPHS